MTEKDILRVIQNADGKFYEEAEQEAQQTHTPAIRQNVTRRIIAVASAAAVLAVSVSAGIYASRNRGLTVGTSQNDIESIVEQVTNVRTDAMQTALPTASANELGGHGPIRMSVNNLIMKDDENWYINASAAAISDKEYLKLNALGEAEKERYNSLSGLWPDRCGSGEYYYYDTATRTVSLWNGTETPEKLFTLESASPESNLFDEQHGIDLFYIAKLSDRQYLCGGYSTNRSTQEKVYFWNTYDLEGHFSSSSSLPLKIDGTTFLPPLNVFSDGAQGVYLDDGGSDSDDGRFLRHLTLTSDKHNLEGKTLNIKLDGESGLWNGAVYTFEPTDGDNQNDYYWDYVRYDLETGEKTVLLNKVDWADENHKLLFRGDQLYVAGADFLQIMDLDLKNTLFVELSVPAPLNILYLQPTQIDMCGDTIFVEYRNAGLDETPIYMLCDLMTNKAQYVSALNIDADEQTETTTAPTETTKQTETTTTQANTDGTNYLGGHGELKQFPQNWCMWDDDHWYESMVYGVPKSDAKYLPRERTAYDNQTYCVRDIFTDSIDGTLYHLRHSDDYMKSYIARINADGTETTVFPNLAEPFCKSGEDYVVYMANIANLGNDNYYIEANLLPRGADPDHERGIEITEIYNTATETVKGKLAEEIPATSDLSCTLRYSSGSETGIYLGYSLWSAPSHSKVIRIERFNPEGENETVLETDICHESWFVYDDCIYYVSNEDQNYCKYNMKTKETTVLIEHTGWNPPETGICNLRFVNGTVYTIKDGGTLIYGDLEMQEQHEWKIEYPETMEVFADFCFVQGVCDNVVFIVNSDAQFSPEVNSGDDAAGIRMYSRHEYTILYHTDTGKVQYIYDPEFYTPPAEN